MEKINIAELLKDCPQGMELDCAMYDDVTLYEVDLYKTFPILLVRKNGERLFTTRYGQYQTTVDSKCIIFPKGKTTWEGFVPPYVFKDGDIVITTLGNIAIIRKHVGEESFCICGLMVDNNFYKNEVTKVCVKRLATEEEKQKLFDAIKENGYKWNAETKTLEKLVEPKFNVGDWVVDSQGLTHQIERVVENVTTHTFGYDIVGGGYFNDDTECVHLWTINDAKDGDVLATEDKNFTTPFVAIYKNIGDTVYDNITFNSHCFIGFDGNFYGGEEGHTIEDIHPATKEQSDLLFQKMKEAGYTWSKTLKKVIEPKFKVGDKIRGKYTGYVYTISNITSTGYKFTDGTEVDFEDACCFELNLNKFDITALIPFESRVLARDSKEHKWVPAIWGYYDSNDTDFPYKTIGSMFKYCIPYEQNEHLLDTTDDCDEFYKTWE